MTDTQTFTAPTGEVYELGEFVDGYKFSDETTRHEVILYRPEEYLAYYTAFATCRRGGVDILWNTLEEVVPRSEDADKEILFALADCYDELVFLTGSYDLEEASQDVISRAGAILKNRLSPGQRRARAEAVSDSLKHREVSDERDYHGIR